MKVIVLSCNTGEGHNTAGNAIIEGMHARGVEADMVNPRAVWFYLQSRAADLHASLQIGALLRQ